MPNDNRSKPTPRPESTPDKKIRDLPEKKGSTKRDEQVKGGRSGIIMEE